MEIAAVIGLYVGGMIGAGFASGQELVVFFLRYGRAGLLGILFSTVVLTLGSALILDFCARRGCRSYEDLFQDFGPRPAAILEKAYSLILLVAGAVMLAGCAALAGKHPPLFLRVGTSVLIGGVLWRGPGKTFSVGRWLAPAIVAFLAGLALYGLLAEGPSVPRTGSWRALDGALLYSTYNLGLSGAVLGSAARLLPGKKGRWTAALVANLVIGLTMLLLCLALSGLSSTELAHPLPLQGVAAAAGPWALQAYRVVLWASMFSTGLAHCYALCTRLAAGGRIAWKQAVLGVTVLSTALSYWGFVSLIRFAYPLLGLAVLWCLPYLVRSWLQEKHG